MKKTYKVKNEVVITKNTKIGKVKIEIKKGMLQRKLKEMYDAGYSEYIEEVIEDTNKKTKKNSQSSNEK